MESYLLVTKVILISIITAHTTLFNYSSYKIATGCPDKNGYPDCIIAHFCVIFAPSFIGYHFYVLCHCLSMDTNKVPIGHLQILTGIWTTPIIVGYPIGFGFILLNMNLESLSYTMPALFFAYICIISILRSGLQTLEELKENRKAIEDRTQNNIREIEI